MRFIGTLVLFLILTFNVGYSQIRENLFEGTGFSVMPSINYVTSSSIQLNSNSNNVIEQNLTENLTGGIGYGLSIRKRFGDDLILGVSTEYIRIEDNDLSYRVFNGASSVNLKVKETIWAVPVEISAYYKLPRFAEEFGLYLGGGIGVYFGDRERQILGLKTETKSTDQALNFHIATGAEYQIFRSLSAVFEVTFREGEYGVVSEFPTDQIIVNGTRYPIQQEYDSKVYLDGLKLGLGLNYYFN